MALSCYSNWDMFQLFEFNSNMKIAVPQEEAHLPSDLFIEDFGLTEEYNSIDQILFQPNDSLSIQNCKPQLPSLSTPCESELTLTPETFQLVQEFEPFHNYPKRQRIAHEGYPHFYSDSDHVFLNGEEAVFPTLPCFQSGPPVYSAGTFGSVTNPQPKLSTQSIAARQRRRKISEKTQELGKLIPGGHKMNTAEMFQAAYKYIQYLQAQVEILESMDSSCHEDNAHGLVESSLIQEQLYLKDVCLVPAKFVQAVAADDSVLQLKSEILGEIKQLTIASFVK